MTPDYAIRVEGLNKKFGSNFAVRDLSLDVVRGQICGFLGPNGSGKTTTLRMLCGLLTPDSGCGTCLGFDILRQSGQIKRRVGYMTQKFGLYEDLSIRQNLDFVARLYGVAKRRKVVDAMIERIGLTGRRHQLAGVLSGGWKQRLALAACLLPEPELLLLDEPTAGVDPKGRREFWGEIHALVADGLTVLVSTHYMDEAERCHTIAYIAYGKLLARGDQREVIATAGLTTWHVTAHDPIQLAVALHGRPGIDMTVPFGNTLHVSGTDSDRLAAAIVPYRDDPALSWTPAEPGLEDAFIALMNHAPDNTQ